MKKSVFVDGVCVAFILLFVYAALSKLIDYQKFRVELGQSPLLTSYAGLVAWAVLSLEIIISIMLAISRFRYVALYASFTLMVIFSAYIVAITRFSSNVPCHCGGVLEFLGWGWHLILNLIFVVIAAIAILLANNKFFILIKQE